MTSKERSLTKITGLMFIFALLASAAAQVVQPVGAPWDSSLPAVTDWGDSFVLTREVRITLGGAPGHELDGYLFLIFDKQTGFYLQKIYLGAPPSDHAIPSATDEHRRYHVGVTKNGIGVFDYQRPLTLNVRWSNPTDKAYSIDDAETKVLGWAGSHVKGGHLAYGFDHSANGLDCIGWEIFSATGSQYVPDTLLSFERRDGAWEITFDGFMRPVGSKSIPQEEKDRRGLKARVRLGTNNWAGAKEFVCLDDEMKERACPAAAVRFRVKSLCEF
jgi:hypothetical protein